MANEPLASIRHPPIQLLLPSLAIRLIQKYDSGVKALQIAGVRFGRLVALSKCGVGVGGIRWKCRCDCGNEVIAIGAKLTQGLKQSCGCLVKDLLRQRLQTHGMKSVPEYRNWKNMRTRCLNKNRITYSRYGGRGITVCERWNNFANFYADMGPKPSPKHTLDRINNDGNYEPSNCRWATRATQTQNRYNNIVITYKGISLTAREWAKAVGVSDRTIRRRFHAGMTTAKILGMEQCG